MRRWLTILLFVAAASGGVLSAQGPFSAQIVAALTSLGLMGTPAYADGECPEWSAASGKFVPATCGGGGGTPGGADTSVQFNDGGAFGGFGTWDGSTLAVPGEVTAEGDVHVSGDGENVELGASAGLGAYLALGNSGTRQSSTDGVWTLLGRGDGNDFELDIDLDNGPADTVAMSANASILTWNSNRVVTQNILPAYNLTFIFDGGGSVISTGFKGCTAVPAAGTILSWNILSDDAGSPTSGSLVVDLWEDTQDNYPPTDADSITASALPTLTTATSAFSSTLTGWSTALVNGGTTATISNLCANVDSVTSLTKAKLIVRVQP